MPITRSPYVHRRDEGGRRPSRSGRTAATSRDQPGVLLLAAGRRPPPTGAASARPGGGGQFDGPRGKPPRALPSSIRRIAYFQYAMCSVEHPDALPAGGRPPPRLRRRRPRACAPIGVGPAVPGAMARAGWIAWTRRSSGAIRTSPRLTMFSSAPARGGRASHLPPREIQQHPRPVHRTPDRLVAFQHAPVTQQKRPVVLAASDQRQLLGLRVPDVDARCSSSSAPSHQSGTVAPWRSPWRQSATTKATGTRSWKQRPAEDASASRRRSRRPDDRSRGSRGRGCRASGRCPGVRRQTQP